MAHLVHKKNNSFELRFSLFQKRKVINLTGLSNGQLETWKENVQLIADAISSDRPVDSTLLFWADNLPIPLRKKLHSKGLVGPDPRTLETEDANEPTLHQYIDRYFEARKSESKESTWTFYCHTKKRLKEFFPESTKLKDVDAMQAREFRVWMETKSNKRDKKRDGISVNTVRRRTGLCQQIFKQAIEDGYITHNPFAKMPSKVKANKERQFYVERAVIFELLTHIKEPRWRCLIALARFGALRMPSEAVNLKWSDIDFESKRMLIHQPKVEHHEGRETKIVPLFPEIERELIALLDAPFKTESPRVFPWLTKHTNIRTQLERFIRRTNRISLEMYGPDAPQIDQWPKLWQNLRASACTDMARTLPAHVATAICGHTEQIAREHYWMISESDMDRALDVGSLLEQQQRRIINFEDAVKAKGA